MPVGIDRQRRDVGSVDPAGLLPPGPLHAVLPGRAAMPDNLRPVPPSPEPTGRGRGPRLERRLLSHACGVATGDPLAPPRVPPRQPRAPPRPCHASARPCEGGARLRPVPPSDRHATVRGDAQIRPVPPFDCPGFFSPTPFDRCRLDRAPACHTLRPAPAARHAPTRPPRTAPATATTAPRPAHAPRAPRRPCRASPFD